MLINLVSPSGLSPIGYLRWSPRGGVDSDHQPRKDLQEMRRNPTEVR